LQEALFITFIHPILFPLNAPHLSTAANGWQHISLLSATPVRENLLQTIYTLVPAGRFNHLQRCGLFSA